MGELIGNLLGNPIILILIIGALSKLLSGDNKEQEKEQRQPNRPRPRPTNVPKPTPTPSGGAKTEKPQTMVETTSIEEQQKQQMERLVGKMKTTVDQSVEESAKQVSDQQDKMKDNLINTKKKSVNPNEERFRKRVKENLSSTGLVDSVIMAEVLGPPKARRPYRSVVDDRRRS